MVQPHEIFRQGVSPPPPTPSLFRNRWTKLRPTHEHRICQISSPGSLYFQALLKPKFIQNPSRFHGLPHLKKSLFEELLFRLGGGGGKSFFRWGPLFRQIRWLSIVFSLFRRNTEENEEALGHAQVPDNTRAKEPLKTSKIRFQWRSLLEEHIVLCATDFSASDCTPGTG